MTEMLPAFTGDIIMEYAFGFSYNQLESPNFESFHKAFVAIGSSAHVASFFPWIITAMNLLPDTWIEKAQPSMLSLLRLKRRRKKSDRPGLLGPLVNNRPCN
jgi:hypothetical protein